jgi:hypothetical protein
VSRPRKSNEVVAVPQGIPDALRCCGNCDAYSPYLKPILGWGRCMRHFEHTVPTHDGTREEVFTPRVSDRMSCSSWQEKLPPQDPAT